MAKLYLLCVFLFNNVLLRHNYAHLLTCNLQLLSHYNGRNHVVCKRKIFIILPFKQKIWNHWSKEKLEQGCLLMYRSYHINIYNIQGTSYELCLIYTCTDRSFMLQLVPRCPAWIQRQKWNSFADLATMRISINL